MSDKLILSIYGILLMGGGIMGYVKAKSSMSLAMGVGSGLVIVLGVWLYSMNPKGAWILWSCTTGFLCLAFLMRLLKTHAFMPSGMLLAISLGVLIFCLLRLKSS
jgi:uncharacterized membrane protein (UPF0136 family)